MKRTFFLTAIAVLTATLCLFVVQSCKKESTSAAVQQSGQSTKNLKEFWESHLVTADLDGTDDFESDEAEADERANPNPQAYPPRSKQFGVLGKTWTQYWWQRMLSFNCANQPIFDTGNYDDVNQGGPVFFLAGNSGGTTVRSVNIPYGKAIFFPIINAYWDNPCPPDPSDAPAPGQTVEQYLAKRVNQMINSVSFVSVTLDGVPFTDLHRYKMRSDMWQFAANPDLANCMDYCITGQPDQYFMSHGYWVMLKPLTPGNHVLNFKGTAAGGAFNLDVTYNINQLAF